MAYTSQYTGQQIDQAVGTYLAGNIKSTSTFEVKATSAYWKDSTSSTFNGKYYISISTFGSLNVGAYPDIFIITEDGEKIIPEINYKNSQDGSFEIYSNKMVAGTVVLLGTSQTKTQIVFTVKNGTKDSYKEFIYSVASGDIFYTVFSKGLDGLKCNSLNEVVTDDTGNVRLYSNGEGSPIIGSNIIVSNGVYTTFTN